MVEFFVPWSDTQRRYHGECSSHMLTGQEWGDEYMLGDKKPFKLRTLASETGATDLSSLRRSA